MNRFIQFTFMAALLWFLYPDEAWCAGCKKCNARAVELRKRLLEQQQKKESGEATSYDVSMTDWKASDVAANDSASDKTNAKDKDKDKDKKKRKKKSDSLNNQY